MKEKRRCHKCEYSKEGDTLFVFCHIKQISVLRCLHCHYYIKRRKTEKL